LNVNSGTLTVAILALLAGLVGAYALRAALTPAEVVEVPPPEEIFVPLAGSDLPANRTIAMGDIAMVGMTPKEYEEREFPSSLVMMEPTQFIGRILREPIQQGEPFLTTAVYLEGTGPDITSLLKPGFRAATLVLDPSAVGSARAGGTVDVLFRSTPQEGGEGEVDIPEKTVTLLKAIEVLSIQQPLPRAQQSDPNVLDIRRLNAPPETAMTTVILAVSLNDANVLQAVTGRGDLRLIPRAATETIDNMVASVDEGMTLADVLGIKPEPVVTITPFVTDIYRGGTMSRNVFIGGVSVTGAEDDAAAAAAAGTDLPTGDQPVLPPAADPVSP